MWWPHCTVIEAYCTHIIEKCVEGLPEKEALLGGIRSIRSKASEMV